MKLKFSNDFVIHTFIDFKRNRITVYVIFKTLMVQGDLEEESIKNPCTRLASVCTFDRKESNIKLIRADFANIHHKFDVWHSARIFVKKL